MAQVHDSLYWDVSPHAPLLTALLVGLVLLSTGLFTQDFRPRLRWVFRGAILGTLALGCPYTQWVVLQPVHMSALRPLVEKARSVQLVGMKEAEVLALLGEPTSSGSSTPGAVTWNYHPVPFYLTGATLQVLVRDGVVSGWEPYD